jgi:xanthine dehydrogenase small subunit
LLPLARFLRERQRLSGTKIACGEGACGACTVLLGTPDAEGGFSYRLVNSCLLSMYQVDGCHLVTIEGISPENGALSRVQQTVVDCHATQCGFCTPGIVLALTAAKETQTFAPDSLTGNLCRCTGYLGIREAVSQIGAVPQEDWVSLNRRYPPEEIAAELTETHQKPFLIETPEQTVFAPTTLEDATAFLSQSPEAVIVAGATEINVAVGAGERDAPRSVCWLGHIVELTTLRREDDALVLGAGATWTDIEAFAQTAFPLLAGLLKQFAGPQIKNIGTLGGNILHASPVADSLPLLLALDARAVAVGSNGARREIPVETLTLQSGEILVSVVLPLPSPDQILWVYKVSRRQAFDRAVVSAAICVTRCAEMGSITRSRVAMGGIGANVRRLSAAETALQGMPFTEETFLVASKAARAETATTAGSAYQSQLAGNLLLKFFQETTEGQVAG